MGKTKLTLSQEAQVLFYLENYHGKQMKGEARTMMYDIYRMFKQDRDKDVCSCLDRDTFKKVEGFINNIDWSDETKTSPKMQQVLPNQYVEPIELEEVSTQQVEVDVKKLQRALDKRKRTTIPPEDVSKLQKPTKRRARKKKE